MVLVAGAAQRVLVLLQVEVLDEVAHPLAAVAQHRFAVPPLVGERDLLDARQDHGVEVLAHLHQDVLALSVIVAIHVHNYMSSRA